MKTITLTKGQTALIDDRDYPLVSQHKWQARPDKNTWYASTSINGRTVLMHRFILNPLPGFQVDHKDGDARNNRRSNLRLVTSQMNNWNRRPLKNRNTKYKGIDLKQGKWRVQIHVDGKKIHGGYFLDEIEAAKAYDQKAFELFGKYAYLNFPELYSGPPFVSYR